MTGGANHAEPCKIVEASQTTSRGGLVQNLGQTKSQRFTAQPLTWSAAQQTAQLGVLHYPPKSNKQHYCSVVVLCIFGSYLYTTPCHVTLKLVKPFDGTKKRRTTLNSKLRFVEVLPLCQHEMLAGARKFQLPGKIKGATGAFYWDTGKKCAWAGARLLLKYVFLSCAKLNLIIFVIKAINGKKKNLWPKTVSAGKHHISVCSNLIKVLS